MSAETSMILAPGEQEDDGWPHAVPPVPVRRLGVMLRRGWEATSSGKAVCCHLPVSSELLASEGSMWLLPWWSVSVKMGSEGPVSSLVLVFLQANGGAGCGEHIGAEPWWEVKSKVTESQNSRGWKGPLWVI